MATVREYAYTVVGNTLRLVERDINFDNDVSTHNYGPGVDRGEWNSPLATVTDALQLQYTYTPWYRVNDSSEALVISGYDEDGNGLLSLTIPSSTIAADAWILISGSNRWNGLHQVNAAISSATALVLKTKYNGEAVTEASRAKIDISVMEDESFEIDLPEYLALSLEYYLKARIFEDLGDIEKKVYFMKEFRKQIEKHDTSRQWGARMIASGPYAVR